MTLTESKVWNYYLRKCLRKGFRIETATHLGVPDVFGVTPQGHPVWIELKILKNKGLGELLRPGQKEFIADYGDVIPCVVLGVAERHELRRGVILFNGVEYRVEAAPSCPWTIIIDRLLEKLDIAIRGAKRGRLSKGANEKSK